MSSTKVTEIGANVSDNAQPQNERVLYSPHDVNGKAVREEPPAASSAGIELKPENFRIPQNYSAFAQSKGRKAIRIVKPDSQLWVSIHPEWRMSGIVLTDKVARETYIVLPNLVPEISEDLAAKLLVPYITRDSTIGIWPIKLPSEDGRNDSANETALDIAAHFTNGDWFRLRWNKTDSTYWAQEMSDQIENPIPKWPEGGFGPIFETAFKNRVITNLTHPILRALRGEIL